MNEQEKAVSSAEENDEATAEPSASPLRYSHHKSIAVSAPPKTPPKPTATGQPSVGATADPPKGEPAVSVLGAAPTGDLPRGEDAPSFPPRSSPTFRKISIK